MFLLGHLGIGIGLAYGLERAEFKIRPFHFDYRLVLIGALLPDLVDKPLSLVGIDGGRAYAHTILFAVILTVVAYVLGRRSANLALALGLLIGLWSHLVLDQMWEIPEVALWPALGFGFPVRGLNLESLLEELFTQPYVYGGEILGGIILVAFVFKEKIYTRPVFTRFLHTGLIIRTQVGNREGTAES